MYYALFCSHADIAQIYLGAIAGLVPAKMVQCVAALLDFIYLARRPEHDTASLEAMQAALDCFHELREVFIETGVRENFSLPRQHALVHYHLSIQKFGSPNGLCSSITESKHITAVKETWRRSSRHTPIDQMVRSLTRLGKIAASRVEYGRRGMLHGDVLTAARLELGDEDTVDVQAIQEDTFLTAQAAKDELDAHEVDHMDTSITLAARHGMFWGSRLSNCTNPANPGFKHLNDLANALDQPQLPEDVTRFLHDRVLPDGNFEADMDLEEFPHVSPRAQLGVHQSATIVFHAPSELSGPHGMRREIIRCNPSWYNSYPRYDTVLVTDDPTTWGMPRFRVARVRRLLTVPYDIYQYEGALVEWFTTHGRDPVTGMWLVRPEMDGDVRVSSVIPLSTIARACHLQPALGDRLLPADFPFADTLDAFDEYYVNCYIDYHAHEMIV